MRVIVARSNFSYQRLKTQRTSPIAYSRSWIRVALPLRLRCFLFVASFYQKNLLTHQKTPRYTKHAQCRTEQHHRGPTIRDSACNPWPKQRPPGKTSPRNGNDAAQIADIPNFREI
jgi:hypothetical protein